MPLAENWRCAEIAYFPAFDWLAAGGFRQKQLAPLALAPILRMASSIAAILPLAFATRMLVVLDRS
ncbi:MAG: hypothetical protein JJT96_01890 [Opitutales bacterium]|nr:hypothetical protein [Opitutales bacterium]